MFGALCYSPIDMEYFYHFLRFLGVFAFIIALSLSMLQVASGGTF